MSYQGELINGEKNFFSFNSYCNNEFFIIHKKDGLKRGLTQKQFSLNIIRTILKKYDTCKLKLSYLLL